MKWLSRKTIFIILGILVAAVVLVVALTSFFVDIFWYQSEGFDDVFWTRIFSQIEFGAIIFGLYVVVVGLTILLAHLFSRKKQQVVSEEAVMLPQFGEKLKKYGVWLFIGVGAIFAVTNGFSAGSSWGVWKKFLHGVSFGVSDPIFGNDVSFYVFDLPLFRIIYDHLFGALLLSTVIALGYYLFRRVIWVEKWKLRSSKLVKGHILGMAGLLFALKAVGYYLDKFDILYSTQGGVFGASFTDVNANLPMYEVLFWITLAFGLVAFALTFLKTENFKVLLIIGASFIVLPYLMLSIYPWAVQTLEVDPNEFQAEEEYIGHNIEFTQIAYGLDTVDVMTFGERGELKEIDVEELAEFSEVLPAETPVEVVEEIEVVEGAGGYRALTRTDIEDNRPTIDNIRLWDWSPLGDVYRQMQSFRPYYEFVDVDIDRYMIDGHQKSITLALRELNVDRLDSQANTWQNRHLVYTHGYGAVANTVNEVTKYGQPKFILKDIPLINNMGIDLERPQIYFGEGNMDYSFAPTGADEIDYPRGSTNAFTEYTGEGGIPVDGFWRRLLLSIYLGNIDVLLSDYITEDSNLLIRRNISQRVREVAPYLALDNDPYPVLTDGGIQWIVQCFTTTRLYPYSEPLVDNANYIRNSAVVVIDAYSGKMDFYTMGDDPLIRTWGAIFPGMYKPFEEMPEELQAHIRYPNELFAIQSVVYSTYHMTDPLVFYNKSDRWVIPGRPEGELFNAYYMTMRLPGEENEEFLLISPFVPENRQNMVGWMCARCDPGVYGELVLYTFPTTSLVYGPEQVEGRLNQFDKFSEKRSLWDQQGSSVVIGRMVVIPIEDSVLYVQPVYLKAVGNPIPELRLVLVTYGTEIAMDTTLEGALAQIFGSAAPVVEGDVAEDGEETAETTEAVEAGLTEEVVELPVLSTETAELAELLLKTYDRGQKAMQRGDWAAYGEADAELERLINAISESLSE